AAYRRDLNAFGDWLEQRGVELCATVGADHMSAYILEKRRSGAASSSANRATSSIRMLFRFLFEDGALADNAAQDLKVGKPSRTLPQVISLDLLMNLIDIPDHTTPLGLRDRAMLEVFYATGARVSE